MMAKSPARQQDEISNDTHGNGHIITGNANVTFEGQPVACAGDTAKFADSSEGVIIEGSACVMVNNKRIALISDNTEKDGTIKTGANTIRVGEGEPFVFIGSNVSIGKNVIFGN